MELQKIEVKTEGPVRVNLPPSVAAGTVYKIVNLGPDVLTVIAAGPPTEVTRWKHIRAALRWERRKEAI